LGASPYQISRVECRAAEQKTHRGLNSQAEGAAQQLIRPDAPVAIFSSSFLRRILNAVRGAPVNSGVMLLRFGNVNVFH